METHDSPRPSQYKEYWERVKRVESRTANRVIALGMFLAGGVLYFLPSKIVYRALAFAPVFLLFFLLGEFAASGATRRMRDQAEALLASVRHDLDEWREGASLNGEAWKASPQACQVRNELGWFRKWCDAIALRAAAETWWGRIKGETFNTVLWGSCVYLVANVINQLVSITRRAASHDLPVWVAVLLGVTTLAAMAEVVVGAVAIHKYRGGLKILAKLDTLEGIGRLKEQEVIEELKGLGEAMDQLTGRGSSRGPKKPS